MPDTMGHLSARLFIHYGKSNPFAPMYNVHHLTGHYMVEAGAYDSPVFTVVKSEELRALWSCLLSSGKHRDRDLLVLLVLHSSLRSSTTKNTPDRYYFPVRYSCLPNVLVVRLESLGRSLRI
jgi:hypothetical protein